MTSVTSQAHRTFRNDVQEIRRMSEWWREWSSIHGVSPEVQDKGELCLNEAAANVVQHSVGARTIRATLERVDGATTMVLTDDGPGFDPSAPSGRPLPRTLEETEPGGLGLHILRAYADSVLYKREGGINVLTLTFNDPASA
ncbi:MAG TPA: ATP-binding protein [Vicinamibacterales bacterium]|nr:ATP-binding protein [Vicinamibacterales bacterium]